MTSKPFSDPVRALRDTITIDSEPEALPPVFAARRPLLEDRGHHLEAEAQSKTTASAIADTDSFRAERGTLWVRPWGGK